MGAGATCPVMSNPLSSLLLAAVRRMATRLRLWRARAPQRRFGRDLHVGSRVRLWAPEHLEIGDASYLGHEVSIQTNCLIGRHVLVADRVAFVGRHDHDHRTPGVPVRFGHWVGSQTRPSPFRGEGVVVEDDVWIGYGALLLSGVAVGRGAIVAAGAVVRDSVAPYDIVAGNPAVPVGRRFASEAAVAEHEARMANGRFVFSERGHDHWTVEPGPR